MSYCRWSKTCQWYAYWHCSYEPVAKWDEQLAILDAGFFTYKQVVQMLRDKTVGTIKYAVPSDVPFLTDIMERFVADVDDAHNQRD